MRKIFSKKLLYVLIPLCAIVLLFFLFRQKTPVGPATSSGASWQGLTPGDSARSDVESKLGKAMKENVAGDKIENQYGSLSPTRPHVGIFDKETGTVLFLKQIVAYKENFTTKDLGALYGEKSTILYGPDFVNGFALFVYPDKGVAYLGNSESNTVLEVWYFVPTDIESFIKRWAPDYSLQAKYQPF